MLESPWKIRAVLKLIVQLCELKQGTTERSKCAYLALIFLVMHMVNRVQFFVECWLSDEKKWFDYRTTDEGFPLTLLAICSMNDQAIGRTLLGDENNARGSIVYN